VVDLPSEPFLLQRVVFRRLFAADESAELEQLKAYYSSSEPEEFVQDSLTTLEISQGSIWPVTRFWTEQAERDYAQWLQSHVSANMLFGTGLRADCADFAIALRWIYAHDHGLPAGNQLIISGRLFGSWQSTTSWDQLPTNSDWKKDLRFKAALNYLFQNSYTHSIFRDLYPVKINPLWVSPGVIYLTLRAHGGHTRTLFNVESGKSCNDLRECLTIIYGNQPASERGYIRNFIPYRLNPNQGGFLRFRWPEKNQNGDWVLRPATAMPGYSTEQYSWGRDSYLKQFFSHMNIGTRALSPGN
jgi:hypothetical protein